MAEGAPMVILKLSSDVWKADLALIQVFLAWSSPCSESLTSWGLARSTALALRYSVFSFRER